MTSKSSCSINLLKEERAYTRRRTAPALLVFFVYFTEFVLGALLAVVHTREYTAPSALQGELIRTGNACFGMSAPSWLFACVFAVLLALQGFAWLDRPAELDFYESQPMKRSTRFLIVYLNGILIFAGGFLLPLFLGLILSAGLGAVNAVVLLTALLQAFRVLVLFLGIYSISVLAVMWTGNILIAVLATGTLLLYEILIRWINREACGLFFETFSSANSVGIAPVFSPLYYFYGPFQTTSRFVNDLLYGTKLETPVAGGTFCPLLSRCLPFDLKSLALTAAVTALAYFSYLRRKHEHAQEAVLFRPVRVAVKIALAVLGAVTVGMLLFIYFPENTGTGTAAAFIGIPLAALLICGVMETIYHYRIGDFFSHLPEAGIAALLALLVFTCLRFDLTGYDRYLPAPEELTEVRFVPENTGGYSYWPEYFDEESGESLSAGDFAKRYMHLTDTKAVLALVREAQEKRNQPYKDTTLRVTVTYVKKNGREITRSIPLCADADPELLNQVLGSREYREGHFQIYHDRFLQGMGNRMELSYVSDTDTRRGDSSFYQTFREAYLKDLETYDYSTASGTPALGLVTVFWEDRESGYQIQYPVYRSFSHTIGALKDAGLWSEPVPAAEEISVLQLTADYYVSDPMPEDGGEESRSYLGKSAEFTDPEEIRQILEAVVLNHFNDGWYDGYDGETRPGGIENAQILVRLSADYPGQTLYGDRTVEYTADPSRLPAFAVERLSDITY